MTQTCALHVINNRKAQAVLSLWHAEHFYWFGGFVPPIAIFPPFPASWNIFPMAQWRRLPEFDARGKQFFSPGALPEGGKRITQMKENCEAAIGGGGGGGARPPQFLILKKKKIARIFKKIKKKF